MKNLTCQIKVDEHSSNSLMFGTPLGRYCFKHLLYGIHSASELFQREVISITSDIPGNANSQDDFAVWGETLQAHPQCLRKVFLKIKESGLKLNKSKCLIRKQSIIFLGHIICQKSLQLILQKLKQLLKCPC